MRVLPGNASGWFWHCLARETGKLGHMFSPGHERGPWPWFPYHLDNGCYKLWNSVDNSFDEDYWGSIQVRCWHHLLFWASVNQQKANWAIVPDRPGDWDKTLIKWTQYARIVVNNGLSPAVAVQNGATIEQVRSLDPQPAVVCVGGTTSWKWESAEQWIRDFPRVHILRCNSPEKLVWLEQLGAESTDGTGWNRGDRKQTEGLENWARGLMNGHLYPLWPHVCRQNSKEQLSFA